jgi:hypothetical protein
MYTEGKVHVFIVRLGFVIVTCPNKLELETPKNTISNINQVDKELLPFFFEHLAV